MKNIKFIVLFALACAFMGWVAEAKAVPNDVKAEVTQYPIVHQGGCVWREMKVPCQIYYNDKDEVVYLVIYTIDTTDITHVVKVVNKKEEVLWFNPRFSI